jgi:hypothetical protein
MTISDIFKDITKQIAVGAGVPTCNNWAYQRGDGIVFDGNVSDGESIGINQLDAPNGYVRVTSEFDFTTQTIGSCRNLVEVGCEFALVLWQNTNQPPTELLDKAVYSIAKTKIRPNGYNQPFIDIDRANAIFDEIYSEETATTPQTPPNGLVLAKVVFRVRVKVAYCDLSLPACYVPIPPVPFIFDADALIYIAALENAGGVITAPQKLAINTWFVEMKTANLYAKIKAAYLTIGGTAATHKFNAINPVDTNAAFRLSFVGGWVHSATGALPNGINTYADTFFIPSVNATPNSISMGYYSGTNSVGSFIEIGVNGVGGNSGQGQLYIAPNVSGAAFLAVNTTGNAGIPSVTPTGMFVTSRNDGITMRLHRNAVQIASNAGLPVTASDKKIYVGGRNVNNSSFTPTNRECRGAFIADGLSETEANAISQVFMNLQIALGRNI